MRKYNVPCPEDLLIQLERLNYEISMEGTVVDRFLDRHLNEPEALNSPIFKQYMQNLAEKNVEYELLKEEVTQSVLQNLTGHQFNWQLNFLTGQIEVEILCDCDITCLE